jgi:hypothetical protein
MKGIPDAITGLLEKKAVNTALGSKKIAALEGLGATVSGTMTKMSDKVDEVMGSLKKTIRKHGDEAASSVDDVAEAVVNDVSQSIWKNADYLDELASSGVKYNPDDVLAVTKTTDGNLVWLENGSSSADMEHILEHADDFSNKGIQQNQIQDLVMESLTNGEVVGYQGSGTGRPIYKVVFNGQTQHTAITVGSNGFIVGANPTTWP